jgi:putative PIN family toxin of toxin-antitoxin system
MIVVIDTSEWISAMHFERRQSSPVLALERARNQDTLAICAEIEAEICRILVMKFHWELEQVTYRLSVLLARAARVSISANLHVCHDPNDDMVLECAQQAMAQIIHSGDIDLLDMGSFEGIQILTPAQYLALYCCPPAAYCNTPSPIATACSWAW